MKRAYFQSRFGIAGLIGVMIWSLMPGVSALARLAHRKPNAARITLARHAEVRATAGPTGVLIEWRTSFELDNLGFNIYRDDGGGRTQVNPSLIAGSAMIAGQGTPLYAGYSYRWFDPKGSRDSRYYLEDVDVKDVNNVSGPYAPVWIGNISKGEQAKLMSEVAAQPSANIQTEGPAGTLDVNPVTLGSQQSQWDIAAQPGLKIGIKQDGWYRVTQPEMVNAGFTPSVDAANLRLFVEANEVPIEVSRNSGQLGANDFIEFYATGVDTLTTDTHVYYLINGTQPGLRVPVSGEIQPNAKPTPTPAPTPAPMPRPLPATSPNQSTITTNNSATGFRLNSVSSGGYLAQDDRRDRIGITSPQPGSNSSQNSVEGNDSISIAPSRDANSVRTGGAAPAPLGKATEAPRALKPDNRGSTTDSSSSRTRLGRTTKTLSNTRRSRHRRARQRRGHAFNSRRRRSHVFTLAGTPAAFLYEVQRKERFVYFSSLLNGDAENYFGGSLVSPNTVKTLTATNLQTDSQGTATLRVGLQGTTSQAHLVNVFVNEVMVGTISYSLQQYAEQSFSLPVSQLREGSNDIKFAIAGGTGDHSLFSYARLTYPRILRAASDTLSFAVRPTQSATVDGFTTPNIRVLDISDPAAVQEIHPLVQAAAPGYAATVPSSGRATKGSRRLLALRSDSFMQAASLAFNQPSTLNLGGTANAADLVIITHKDFIPSLTTVLPGTTTSYVDKRTNEGYVVKVVDVEDVFDEFSYGAHRPQAITDFLARARASWTRAPRYLLLVGDASYDPRNYEGAGSFDFVPTKLIDTLFMEAASDDTMTDFNNDGVPEIPSGRLPVRTVSEANLVISKIVNFSPTNVPQSALMVADTQGSYFFNFETANDQLSSNYLTPAGIPVQKVYRRLEPSDAAARADIISRINAGTALVNYSGHGNVDVWTGAPIFSGSDAQALTNGNKLPLVIVMDCLNGYFMAPQLDCVSEALMKAPNGGAIASFSSSGLTEPIGQHQMGQALFSLLYSGPPIALGDATRQAKAATTDFDVQRTWILFGDPTMKIR